MLGEILSIQPGELKFPFELKKQVSTTLRLANMTSEHVAFKVKTTSPKKYCVRPNTGIIPPQSSTEVVVTMQAQKEAPADMQCKDKFLVQSVLLPGTTKDSQQDFFTKDSGLEIHEVKLRVVFLAPPQPPSPVAESAEEGAMHPSPYPASAMAPRGLTPADQNQKDASEWKAKWTEAKAALAVVTEERNNFQRENQVLKSQVSTASGGSQVATEKRRSGWSTITMLLVAFIFLLLGYYAGQQPSLAAGPASSGEL